MISIGAYSQTDSTTIHFFYLEKDLSLISELNNIQYLGLSCSDIKMKGKRFLFSFDEYKNGKKINQDTSNLFCKEQRIPFVMGKDTNYLVMNFCDKKSFHQEDSIIKIRFVGKLQKDTFKLLIDYPSIQLSNTFIGNEDYSFREITCSSNHDIKLKINTLTPILAYTPPFEVGSGVGSYCLLGMEKIDSWFEKFKVRHYYIINLKIE